MTGLSNTFGLNGLALPNRMMMPPMTRTRAVGDDLATGLMHDH